MARSEKKKNERKAGTTACGVLKHPVRVRILEVLDEQDTSPIQFIHREMGQLPKKFKTEQQALTYVAYHFRTLWKEGCIDIVETVQRRGATEHVYRGRARAFHSDEDYAQMNLEERQAISRVTLQSLIARADGAIIAGTFDKRPDRHLSWVSMELDEKGWAELHDLQAEALQRAEAIKMASAERVVGAGSTEGFRATFGALAFESPPLAPAPTQP